MVPGLRCAGEPDFPTPEPIVAAAIAAASMGSGVGKSGSPAPKPMTGSPAAFRALAFASTAIVADGGMAAMRFEIALIIRDSGT